MSEPVYMSFEKPDRPAKKPKKERQRRPRAADLVPRLPPGAKMVVAEPEDIEAARKMIARNQELLIADAMNFALADTLIDAEGNEVTNADKRGWHSTAQTHLMAYGTMHGAKAATKLEVTPGERVMDAIAARIAKFQGSSDLQDAEVLELESYVEAEVVDEDLDDEGTAP